MKGANFYWADGWKLSTNVIALQIFYQYQLSIVYFKSKTANQKS
jgi:hypothetical protein